MYMQYKNVSDVQFKTESQNTDGKMRFEGYLSVFGNVDSYGDVVEKGAFAATIKSLTDSGRSLPVLENHGGWKIGAEDTTPIGYFESLKEDSHGLYVKGVLYSTDRGKSIYTILKEAPTGTMGMSIGYRVIKSRNATREEYSKSGVVQYLEELELLEGSIVTFPANTEARVEDVKADIMVLSSFERALKEEGYNARDAKTIVSIFKKSINPKSDAIKEDQDDSAKYVLALSDFCRVLDEEARQKEENDTISLLKSFTL